MTELETMIDDSEDFLFFLIYYIILHTYKHCIVPTRMRFEIPRALLSYILVYKYMPVQYSVISYISILYMRYYTYIYIICFHLTT